MNWRRRPDLNRGWSSWICRLPAVQAAGICTFRPDLWDLEAPGRFELPVEVLQPSTCPSKQARNREFIALFYRLGPPESAGIRPQRVALRVALSSSSIRSAAVARSPSLTMLSNLARRAGRRVSAPEATTGAHSRDHPVGLSSSRAAHHELSEIMARRLRRGRVPCPHSSRPPSPLG